MSTLYRVENRLTNQGLWYDRYGRYNAFIRQFGDALCHDVPMGFDNRLKDGGDWLSACDNVQDMAKWFNLHDLQRLHALGYRLYQIDVDFYRTINGHAVFLRQDAFETKEVPISVINSQWGMQL